MPILFSFNDVLQNSKSELRDVVHQFLKLSENKKHLSSFEYAKQFLAILRAAFRGVGGALENWIIAQRMIANFTPSRNNVVSRGVIENFKTAIQGMPNVPAGLVPGIRLYVGKIAGGAYNIVAVPICGLPFNPATREIEHTQDIEMQFFALNGKEFFALDVSNNRIIDDIETAKNLIAIKDAMAIDPDVPPTEVVYFSVDKYNSFLTSTEPGADLTFHFARLNSEDSLTLVIEDGVSGAYFNRGDLIPPPSPISDSFLYP